MQRELPFRKDEKKWSSSSRVNSIFRTYDREKRQPLYLKKEKKIVPLKMASPSSDRKFLVEWGTLGDTVGSLELVDVTNNATGLTNGRARERVSVLNAFSMGW